MNYIRYTEGRGYFATTEAVGTDATTIINLATFATMNIGQDWVTDWKKIRTEIKNIAVARTSNNNISAWTTEQWNLFNTEEKIILAKFMPNKISGVYLFELASQGLIDINDCAEYFDSNSRQARKQRWLKCRKIVMTSFAVSDSMGWIQKNVKSFVNADWPNGINLSDAYIDGYEFKEDDFLYGLGDFVDNEFRNSGLTPNSMNINEICDYLLDILLNGNY